jgi:hypothetical protein
MSSEYGTPLQAMSPDSLPLPRRRCLGEAEAVEQLAGVGDVELKLRLVLLLPSLVTHLPVPFRSPSGLASDSG